jgi:hypothetical protein
LYNGAALGGVSIMRWRTFLLLALLATLCTGGSFTCHYSNDGDSGPPATRP